jgi:hypothetical protein
MGLKPECPVISWICCRETGRLGMGDGCRPAPLQMRHVSRIQEQVAFIFKLVEGSSEWIAVQMDSLVDEKML